MQMILLTVSELCASLTCIGMGAGIVQVILVPVLCLDQLRAITSTVNYWELFQVKYYSVIVAIVSILVGVYFTTIGILYHEDGFGFPGPATCRLLSPARAPWLQIPSSAVLPVGLLLATILYLILIWKIKHSAGIQFARRSVLRMVTCQIIIHWLKFAPIAAILIVRQLTLSKMRNVLVIIEWIFIFSLSFVPIANPIAYGLCSSAYRRALRSLGSSLTGSASSKNPVSVSEEK